MENMSNEQNTTGTGTFSNLTAASGGNPAQITYQPSAADVSNTGMIDAHVVLNSGLSTQETLFNSVFEIVTQ